MKILVVGHKQHGKDTVSKHLNELFGLTWASSSLVACEHAVFPTLSARYGYKTIEECYDDRDNHRTEWFDLIVQYNTPDLTKLVRIIFNDNDIYCGLRNVDELFAMKAAGLVDVVIWVDASKRKPLESSSSMTITKEHADVYLDNNGPEDALPPLIKTLGKFLRL